MNPAEEVTSATNKATLRPAALWLAALLFIITALLFLRATKADFLVYDDTTFVTRNPHVKTGLTLDNVGHAFVGLDEVNWEPLSTLSHALDCQIFGLKPWGHHLVNVLIHAFNTAGLFLLLFKMAGARWRSLIVASVFGLHPLRVESVAWIAERKDVLCMSFWLLATWAYVCYVESGKTAIARWYYRLCLLLFALGLMAKPMMVTFPFFLALLDYWPLKRIAGFKSVVLDKIPLLMLTAGDCLVTFLLQKQYGALDTILPFYVRAGNALIGYASYLGKFFWARQHGCALSLERPLDGAAINSRRRAHPWDFRRRIRAQAARALGHCWLALVFGHADPGHWFGPGGRAIHCRPLHLHPNDWNSSGPGVGSL